MTTEKLLDIILPAILGTATLLLFVVIAVA